MAGLSSGGDKDEVLGTTWHKETSTINLLVRMGQYGNKAWESNCIQNSPTRQCESINEALTIKQGEGRLHVVYPQLSLG